MFKIISDMLIPPEGSPTTAYRRAGALNLLLGMIWLSVIFILIVFTTEEGGSPSPILLPIGLIGLILWCAGIHYLIWGGVRSSAGLLNIGRVIISGAVGFGSVIASSALLGALFGLIKNAS